MIGGLDRRHPSTAQVARWFAYDHLPAGRPREVSQDCELLARRLLTALPDGPELTVALRKLLEAKDCAVRAAIASAQDREFVGDPGSPTHPNPEGTPDDT